MDLVVRADEGALRLQRVGEGSHVQRHDVGGLLHLPAVQQPVHQSPGQVALGTETVDSATEGRNGGEVALSGMTDTDLEFTGVEQSNKCITSPPHPPPALPTIEAYGSAHGKEKKIFKNGRAAVPVRDCPDTHCCEGLAGARCSGTVPLLLRSDPPPGVLEASPFLLWPRLIATSLLNPFPESPTDFTIIQKRYKMVNSILVLNTQEQNGEH